MQIQPLEQQEPGGAVPASAALRLLQSPAPGGPPRRSTLRMIGLVRACSGEPIPDARLEWWHPADREGVVPDARHSTSTGGRGGFDVVADGADVHLTVVVRADGYLPLEVRLVPLPGLPPISPPICRSGRAPLAVRPGANDQMECWCEFALTPSRPLRAV